MTIEHESPPEETPVDPTVAGHVKDGAADSPVKDAAWPEESVLDVSVVVPVQSSDAEVEQVFDALGRELDDEGCDWEMFFVFDGVSGKAYSTVQALLSKHP
ncbi:MAG: hypothetical protein ACI8PQ_000543, partial [Planctomycetota bacterium]